MASIGTVIRHYATRYAALVDEARMLNPEHWPAPRDIMRYALSGASLPDSAYSMTILVKRRTIKEPTDIDAATKMRILWYSYAAGDEAPLFHNDDHAGAFNDHFFATPLQRLTRGMDDAAKQAAEADMRRDTKVKEWDQQAEDGLDAIFNPPQRTYGLKEQPALAAEPAG